MSFEIRWFFEGSCSSEIINWMQAKNCKSKEQPDHYLLLPEEHSTFIGVKKSRGTFDIKYRKLFYELSVLNGDITGKVEFWDKCRIKLTDPENYSFQGISFEQVKIDKIRHTKAYDITLPNLEIKPSEKDVDQGVKLELATIKTQRGDWWSLAFDCFANSTEKQRKIMEFGVGEILKDYEGPKLKIENSLSYPEWISRMYKE